MGTGWLYLDPQTGEGQVEHGPVDEAGLAGLLREGRMTSAVPIRLIDDAEWRPLRERLPELGAEPPPSPDLNRGRTPAPPGSSWVDTAPHPWRRYFARLLDGLLISWLFFSVGLEVLAALSPAAAHGAIRVMIDPERRWLVGLTLLALTIPVLALMIGSTGLSVGKWFFGVKVVRPDGRPIGLGAGMRREFLVWSCGQAAGVPIICWITAWMAYKALRDTGHTTWDAPEDWVVIHRRPGGLQVILVVIGVAAIPLIFVMLIARG